MKTSTLLKFAFLSVMMISSSIVSDCQTIPSKSDSAAGIWLGELIIPDQARLRIALTVVTGTGNLYKGSLNILDQATGEIPCDEVIFRNDTLTATLKNLGIVISGPVDVNGKNIDGQFRQAGAVFPVSFAHVEKLPELLRPQEPKSPFPYIVEEVVFENKEAGVKLSGTLTIPQKKGKFAAVILVTGSGQQDRNEEIGKHKPFHVIADYLTRRGIVVLRYDDRGKGGSTGNFGTSTIADFASDVLSGISYLKGRSEVKPGHIGIIGHSEGGIVATLAASESSDVAFIVALAGLIRNFDDVVLGQLLEQSKQSGKSQADIELEKSWRKSIYNVAKEKTDSVTAAEKLWAIYNNLSPDEIKRLNWPKGRHDAQIRQVLGSSWRYNLSLDNKETLLKVGCPILALYGELDRQVYADENIAYVEECRLHGNKNIEIHKLPGLNHLFQTATTGSEYEYIRIEETMAPSALDLMTEWIEKHK